MSGYIVGDNRLELPREAALIQTWRYPDGQVWSEMYRIERGYFLRFPLIADFMIPTGFDEGNVTCSPAFGAEQDTVDHVFRNQVLPLVQSQSGKLVFHSCVIEIDGYAHAFMGESGSGKSTLAASFASCGFRFLTDDGLTLELTETGFVAVPSHPSIRLWEDSQHALALADADVAPPLGFTSKARLFAGRRLAFCDLSLPLKRIYFMGDGSSPGIVFRRVNAREAMLSLIEHSFVLDISDRETLSRHFQSLSALVSLPIFFEFDYPRSYDELANVRQALIAHARAEDHAGTPTDD